LIINRAESADEIVRTNTKIALVTLRDYKEC